MLSAESDSSVRLRRIFFPGHVVEVVSGPLVGLCGTVIEYEEDCTVVFRVQRGIYLRMNASKLRKVRDQW